jgi:hypothetical protein
MVLPCKNLFDKGITISWILSLAAIRYTATITMAWSGGGVGEMSGIFFSGSQRSLGTRKIREGLLMAAPGCRGLQPFSVGSLPLNDFFNIPW